jgi:hypothetical protein
MKKFKFFTAHRSPLTAFLICCNLLLLLNLVVSCQRDTVEKAVDKPVSNVSAADRGPCPNPGMCEFYFTADQDATLEICGDILPNSGTCNYGCPSQNNASYSIQVTANQTYKVCYVVGTSVCIRNTTTAYAVDLTVAFEFSGNLPVTIPISGVACFNSNGGCTDIDDGC